MRRLVQALHRLRASGEHGGLSLELAILAPALLALIGLIIVAGRTGGAHTNVDAAANNAARAASISRTSGEAHSSAVSAARTTLTDRGMACPTPGITVDTSGVNSPVGQVGIVRVTVTCTVQLADLGLPFGGSRTVTAEATSVVDAYRQRSAP